MISLKKNKSFVIIFIAVFLASWILGVLRFDHRWAQILDSILLFPCGLIFATLDNYNWAHFGKSHILNDEFFSLFTFLLSVVGQTFIYYWIYKMIVKCRKNKKEVSVSD